MALKFYCHVINNTYTPPPPPPPPPQCCIGTGIGIGKSAVIRMCKVPCSMATSPQISLEKGNWVKLICGASFQDVVDIRNLSLVYTLAGVDCIDCAADVAVVNAVNEGINAATAMLPIRRPWVMISVNDDHDLHFRKAEFDPQDCPIDCSRPCQNICPANAISNQGVMTDRCYGCGRCFPVCPYDKIEALSYVRDAAATSKLLERDDVDALEIHTNGRQTASFKELWNDLGDSVNHLRLVALDGRPMSGDIGRGATRESIAFARRLAFSNEKPPGFLQLAGGTNAHTVEGLKRLNLFQVPMISESRRCDSNALIGGIAYGGYARKIVGRVLSDIQAEAEAEDEDGGATATATAIEIESYPDHLLMALIQAFTLVGGVKSYK